MPTVEELQAQITNLQATFNNFITQFMGGEIPLKFKVPIGTGCPFITIEPVGGLYGKIRITAFNAETAFGIFYNTTPGPLTDNQGRGRDVDGIAAYMRLDVFEGYNDFWEFAIAPFGLAGTDPNWNQAAYYRMFNGNSTSQEKDPPSGAAFEVQGAAGQDAEIRLAANQANHTPDDMTNISLRAVAGQPAFEIDTYTPFGIGPAPGPKTFKTLKKVDTNTGEMT